MTKQEKETKEEEDRTKRDGAAKTVVGENREMDTFLFDHKTTS